MNRVFILIGVIGIDQNMKNDDFGQFWANLAPEMALIWVIDIDQNMKNDDFWRFWIRVFNDFC